MNDFTEDFQAFLDEIFPDRDGDAILTREGVYEKGKDGIYRFILWDDHSEEIH